MQDTHSFTRLAGITAILAAPIAWISLLVGLSAIHWNFDAFTDAQALLSLGSAGAPLIRWSFLLSMLGSYLLLLPIALLLQRWFSATHANLARLYTLFGIGYCALGALGAAILSAVWPALMTTYAQSLPDQHTTLLATFQLATAIAQDGMQGILQDVLGGVWWLGMGLLLWQGRRGLGAISIVLGAFLLLDTLGIAIDNEALRSIGLSANLLLAPIWAIWAGIVALRAPVTT